MRDGQTGPAIRYAFEQLGHTVKNVDAKKRPRASYAEALEFRPDLVLCSRTDTLAGQVRQIKRTMRVVCCMWNVDTRTNIGHWKHLYPLIQACDYHFVVASRLIPEWKKINSNTFWLPQGLQEEVYHKPKEITDEDRAKYTCDVSWAGHRGGAHQFRESFLNAVSAMGINFKQWGCAENPKIYNEEHNKMVSLSKINLCCSGWRENEKYTSVRNYKIMGAGGFVLELNRAGIGEIFPIDSFGVYESPGDIVNKINYWLTHPEERKVAAEAGYKWVHEKATYTHRIRTALEYMEVA